LPAYDTEEDPQTRLFTSALLVDGVYFRSAMPQGSKKFAEQASAVVCLFALSIPFECPKDLLAYKANPVSENQYFKVVEDQPDAIPQCCEDDGDPCQPHDAGADHPQDRRTEAVGGQSATE